jgi:Fe-S cluster assembly ATP-binding protein
MLSIQNLHADVEEKNILKGVNLEVKPGEVHAIMGPNGSGKSTLAHVLSGKPGYHVSKGSVTLQGASLLGLEPEARAALGVFLAMQYPVAIPGVNNLQFLKAAYNSVRKVRGESLLDAFDFMKLVHAQTDALGMDKAFLKRDLNVGFSGGEKKRNEMLQMCLLEPKLAILDETDSGLDIDALQAVASGVNAFRHEDRAIIMITHYQRLLDYIKPDVVHVFMDGRIVKTGGPDLALKLEAEGYAWVKREKEEAEAAC